MRGPSRASLAEAEQRLSDAVAGDRSAAAELSEELFAVAGLLDGEPGLRRALADATRPEGARTGLARGLLGGRVSRPALDLVVGLVTSRWSRPGDLPDAAERLAVLATAAAAEADGHLDDLEDELFRFGRIVAREPELRSALSNPRVAAEGKQSLLDSLLRGRVTPAALRLITHAAGRPRGRSLDESLEVYARLAAGWRRRLIAVVRVAAALTGQQRGRLAAALSAAYDRDVHLNVVLDPSVVGGMSVQIGDDFIDGSVASRLTALRRRLAS